MFTKKKFASLVVGARYVCGDVVIVCKGEGADRRFVMSGPCGEHSLLVAATDLKRLNAHFTNFVNANH